MARRGPSCMALPRALASALAAVLDDCGFYTLDNLATYLESDESSAAFLAARIRSDECKALVRATLAQDAMSLARASAELRMLGSEIAAIEESDAAHRLQAIRGTKAAQLTCSSWKSVCQRQQRSSRLHSRPLNGATEL